MSTARLRPHSSRLSDVTQTPLDTGDRSKSCQGMLTCTQKWGHSVREGECPTQRKRLSSESSCCPGGEEERCFTSPGSPPQPPPPSPRKQGTGVSVLALPSFSQSLALWSTQRLPAGPWTPCYGGDQGRCLATNSCTASGPKEDTGPERGS